jgi:hypothetical protein
MKLDDFLLKTVSEHEYRNLSEDEIYNLGGNFEILNRLMFSKSRKDIAENLGDVTALANTENQHISFYMNNYFEVFLETQNIWAEDDQNNMLKYFNSLNFELIKSLNNTGIALWCYAFIDILLYTGQHELILDKFIEEAAQCFNLSFFDAAFDEEKLSDEVLSYYIKRQLT